MVTQFNRSDMCMFANYITDLIQKGELEKSDDGKHWATYDQFDKWLSARREKMRINSMISFGKYLLSKERKELYKNHPELGDKNLEERLSEVNHSDVENFLDNYRE